MWCLKCFWTHQDCTDVLIWNPDKQAFEDWILLIHGRDELPLTRNRHADVKADAKDAFTLLESKDYPLFVICGDVATFLIIVNDEWKGRRMCQHVCNGRAICTNKGNTQVGC
jgi:hypothetical protein